MLCLRCAEGKVAGARKYGRDASTVCKQSFEIAIKQLRCLAQPRLPLDRADLKIEIPLPNNQVVFELLQTSIFELIKKEVVSPISCRTSFVTDLMQISDFASQRGVSGRSLKKAPFLACVGHKFPMETELFLEELASYFGI